jgi:hypothetical protein
MPHKVIAVRASYSLLTITSSDRQYKSIKVYPMSNFFDHKYKKNVHIDFQHKIDIRRFSMRNFHNIELLSFKIINFINIASQI